MTPPNVQFIPAPVSAWSDLVSGTTTSSVTTNYYVTHTNIDGDSIWDGRGASNSWWFAQSSATKKIQFYFANDSDRSAALAAYSTWRIVGTDGLSEVASPTTASSSRLIWAVSSSFTALTTYTIQGQ